MFRLGEIQTLTVAKESSHGVYLSDVNSPDSEEMILLPNNQVTDNIKLNSDVDVFIYRDSEDRLIATTTIPKITLGKIALLTVKDITPIGVFLDWGLAKDLLLPFKEQSHEMSIGDSVLVSLYIDKSSRLCATTKIYDLLSCDSLYMKDDIVKGTVFDINQDYGVFVAVDDKYCAMIPAEDCIILPKIGETIEARITEVRPDGKLNLSIRAHINEQMDIDSRVIYEKLLQNNGFLPYHDKTKSTVINTEFAMSKNSFKRAIGRLYKEKKILIKDDGIYLIQDSNQ